MGKDWAWVQEPEGRVVGGCHSSRGWCLMYRGHRFSVSFSSFGSFFLPNTTTVREGKNHGNSSGQNSPWGSENEVPGQCCAPRRLFFFFFCKLVVFKALHLRNGKMCCLSLFPSRGPGVKMDFNGSSGQIQPGSFPRDGAARRGGSRGPGTWPPSCCAQRL